jgi:hypothetical protein
MLRRFLNPLLSVAFVVGPVVVLLQHPIPAQAQQRSERLILKDGGFQSVVKYEMQGDRVHYLSSERYEWEDIPGSLVDWDATNKYNAALSSGKLATKLVETPEEKEEREKEEANSPEIAAGLKLPGSGGVFLFELNKNSKKKSVLRSAINPLASNKQAFEIKGEHAQIQSHVARPTIYIDIDEVQRNDTAPGERFRLIRAEVKKDGRVVGGVKVSIGGKVTQQNIFIPADVTKIGTGEWVKLVPQQDLAAGEYAVVEMLDPQEMNLYVWDFGVNPNAPLNPNTWQPVSKATTSN